MPSRAPTRTEGGSDRNRGARPVIRIAPRRPWHDTGLRDLLASRDLLLAFTQRIVSVQYQQTVLGLGWAVINPVVGTVVFTIIFGRLAGLPSDGLPYPLFALSALVPWQYFARAVSGGSASLAANAHIIGKVYFPRIVLPTSNILAALVDLAANLAVLLAVMLLYGRTPGWQAALLPVFLLLLVLLALGVSLALSALHALYRDVGHLVPFVLQTWMYLTPIIYPAGLVPGAWRWLLYLNPVAGLIAGVRWSLFPDCVRPDWIGLVIGLPVIALVLLGGSWTFRAIEPVLADDV